MISRIEGELLNIEGNRIELRLGNLTYELMIPIADESRLSNLLGQTVDFHTLHYFESQGQGSSFIPRLIGFSSPTERQFFELFTSVKGIGARKALRALQLPFHTVAQAIAAKDLVLLVSLPEIGKRTAETIVAELHGKVDRFIELKPLGDPEDGTDLGSRLEMINDTVAVLTQLGEPAFQARQLVDRAIQVDPEIKAVDALIASALRLRELM